MCRALWNRRHSGLTDPSGPFVPPTSQCMVEVLEWISTFISHYNGCNYIFMLWLKLTQVYKKETPGDTAAGQARSRVKDTFIDKINLYIHDDVIKWKHFPRYWPFVRGIHRSPVNSPHKGQWRGALMFSLICVWINGWVNNREAGDLRRYRAHHDVTVMLRLAHQNRYLN